MSVNLETIFDRADPGDPYLLALNRRDMPEWDTGEARLLKAILATALHEATAPGIAPIVRAAARAWLAGEEAPILVAPLLEALNISPEWLDRLLRQTTATSKRKPYCGHAVQRRSAKATPLRDLP